MKRPPPFCQSAVGINANLSAAPGREICVPLAADTLPLIPLCGSKFARPAAPPRPAITPSHPAIRAFYFGMRSQLVLYCPQSDPSSSEWQPGLGSNPSHRDTVTHPESLLHRIIRPLPRNTAVLNLQPTKRQESAQSSRNNKVLIS